MTTSSSSATTGTSRTSLSCRLCGHQIKFDDRRISHRSGKMIPIDADTNEPHNCPVWKGSQQYQQQQQPQQAQQQQQGIQQQGQQGQRRYLQCNKGCGSEIYFDVNNKTQSGKWIPLDRTTGEPHQCQGQ
jgi:hypothetical protein